jgi:hypothetical protein
MSRPPPRPGFRWRFGTLWRRPDAWQWAVIKIVGLALLMTAAAALPVYLLPHLLITGSIPFTQSDSLRAKAENDLRGTLLTALGALSWEESRICPIGSTSAGRSPTASPKRSISSAPVARKSPKGLMSDWVGSMRWSRSLATLQSCTGPSWRSWPPSSGSTPRRMQAPSSAASLCRNAIKRIDQATKWRQTSRLR